MSVLSNDGISWLIPGFAQAILFGVYTTTSVYCLRWLLYEDEGWKLRKRKDINWVMLALTSFLYVLATLDLCLTVNVTADLVAGTKGPLDPQLNAILGTLEYATWWSVDAVLIYRCWAVYARSWRMICLPSLLWLSCLASVIALRISTHPSNDPSFLLESVFPQGRLMFLACSIALNIYATVAIVFRIWQSTTGRVGPSRRIHNAGRIIAESGALYTISTASNFVVMFGQYDSPTVIFLQTFFDAINFSLTSIAFNLILIRVALQRAQPDDTTMEVTDQKDITTFSTSMATSSDQSERAQGGAF